VLRIGQVVYHDKEGWSVVTNKNSDGFELHSIANRPRRFNCSNDYDFNGKPAKSPRPIVTDRMHSMDTVFFTSDRGIKPAWFVCRRGKKNAEIILNYGENVVNITKVPANKVFRFA
jgi:hypothetical protein